ncbi:hypothetical protein AVEN_51844-1 [Araneus ventricosus]|uniref:Uncharacterized protein n=1 Tax=Araneus ventricosus TaxID=182803 RepID=A0A4Y2TFD9_ARAVE|nr:hypothetical protein AVEN_51844-1 [Araneus ventricosus]
MFRGGGGGGISYLSSHPVRIGGMVTRASPFCASVLFSGPPPPFYSKSNSSWTLPGQVAGGNSFLGRSKRPVAIVSGKEGGPPWPSEPEADEFGTDDFSFGAFLKRDSLMP